MRDVKNCLKWLLIYLALFSLSIIPEVGIIPQSFPTARLSCVYLLFLSACLILRYERRIAGQSMLRAAMLRLAVMVLCLNLFRAMKYSVFGNVSALGRYAWYLYYLPFLAIPTLLFMVSLYIYAKDELRIRRRWIWVAVVTGLLVALVMTNDLHQQVFRFRPGFANWDGDYSYGWGFFVLTVWQYGLYAAAAGVLVFKYSISRLRFRAVLILIPFAIGLMMILLHATGNMPKLYGRTLLEVPEIMCFMAAGMLESCMQLGLIPTNESYRELMAITSVPVQIADRSGQVVYLSRTAQPLTAEQFSAPNGTRIGTHAILRRIPVPGGFGFWQDDTTALDRLNDELAEVREQLSEEASLNRLQNELQERRKTIEQRTLVYDRIASRTQRQLLAISRMARQAMDTTDPDERERCCRQINLLGAYIKRFANLMLLTAENDRLDTGELALAVTEVLRYLNRCGIPSEILSTAEGNVPARQALAVFENFETLIETHLATVSGVFVNLCHQDGALHFKLTMEGLHAAGEACCTESSDGIQTIAEQEDDVLYLCFVIPKGGETA